jgi:PAS domain S-box-containing protein
MLRFAMRLNLPARGVILVGFPLLFQIIFAVWLCLLLEQVQVETQEQVRSRELMSTSGRVLAEIASFYFLFTGSNEDEQQIAEKVSVMSTISADLEHLVTLAGTSRAGNAAELTRLRDDTHNMVELFNNWIAQQRLGDRNADLLRSYFNRQSMSRVKAFVNDLWQLISEEESRYLHTFAEQELSKNRIHNLFLLAALASVLSAILLSLIYGLLVSSPLKRLSQNSVLLSLRRPLMEPLEASDEFAELDKTFRTVAAQIEKASATERAMIDNAEDLICSLDKNGAFTDVNFYCEKMLGFKPDTLIGLRLSDVVVKEDSALAERELLAARKSRQNHSFELRMQHKDTTPIDTKWACFWSGSEDNLFCVVNDNTEQKKIERLKHDFIEVITEDLRAPLTSMKESMHAIIAGRRGPVSESTRGRLQGMAGSMDRLILLADNLLDSQKLSGGEMHLDRRPTDLSFVFAQAAEMMRGTAEAKQVLLVVAQNNCRVHGDKEKLTEVVANLTGNAIKYSPSGTSVTLGAQELGDTVEVTVSDQGPGVPEEYREKIFNAFEQTPEAQAAGQGVGLGLAICKMIVQAHGGTIGVRVGAQGSTFWFRLPKKV